MYSEDLATACMCLKALTYIHEKMLEIPTSYPLLNQAMTLATEGYARTISVECEDAPNGTCDVHTEAVGGLEELIQYFTTAVTYLTLEVDLEGVSDEEKEM